MVLVPGPLFEYGRIPSLHVPLAALTPSAPAAASPLRALVAAARAGAGGRPGVRQDWWLGHAGELGLEAGDAATIFELAFFWRSDLATLPAVDVDQSAAGGPLHGGGELLQPGAEVGLGELSMVLFAHSLDERAPNWDGSGTGSPEKWADAWVGDEADEQGFRLDQPGGLREPPWSPTKPGGGKPKSAARNTGARARFLQVAAGATAILPAPPLHTSSSHPLFTPDWKR